MQISPARRIRRCAGIVGEPVIVAHQKPPLYQAIRWAASLGKTMPQTFAGATPETIVRGVASPAELLWSSNIQNLERSEASLIVARSI
jgi:hypothetical protein